MTRRDDSRQADNSFNTEDKILSVHEAASLLALRPATLYRLAGDGRCPCIRVPGSRLVRFSRRALLKWFWAGETAAMAMGSK